MLDSIPQRDDLEVIVVDDNSDPGIVDFSQYPGHDRPGTRLIFTKKGRGAGYARNVGMDNAQGEWLIFADADDWFVTENMKHLLNYNLPPDCDVLVWDMLQTPFDAPPAICDPTVTIHTDTSLIYRKYISPWYKMVRHRFLSSNKIRFDETLFSNDVTYSVKIALSASKYYFYSSVVYVNDTQPTGLMNTITYRGTCQRINIELKAKRLLKKHNLYWYSSNWYDAMYRISILSFFYFLFKEVILLGFNHTKHDYIMACKYAGISTNPLRNIFRKMR